MKQLNLFDKAIKSFHNTIQSKGIELVTLNEKANKQEDIILDFFRKHPDSAFSPPQVQRLTGMNHTPITSIRRSITNLTTRGLLIKTDIKVKGDYNVDNFCWRLNKIT